MLEKARTKIDNMGMAITESRKNFRSLMEFYAVPPKKPNIEPEPKEFFDLWTAFCAEFKDIWEREIKKAIKDKTNEERRKAQERVDSLSNGFTFTFFFCIFRFFIFFLHFSFFYFFCIFFVFFVSVLIFFSIFSFIFFTFFNSEFALKYFLYFFTVLNLFFHFKFFHIFSFSIFIYFHFTFFLRFLLEFHFSFFCDFCWNFIFHYFFLIISLFISEYIQKLTVQSGASKERSVNHNPQRRPRTRKK